MLISGPDKETYDVNENEKENSENVLIQINT